MPKRLKRKVTPDKYICTKCGHTSADTKCPWHGSEWIRTRDYDEILSELEERGEE